MMHTPKTERDNAVEKCFCQKSPHTHTHTQINMDKPSCKASFTSHFPTKRATSSVFTAHPFLLNVRVTAESDAWTAHGSIVHRVMLINWASTPPAHTWPPLFRHGSVRRTVDFLKHDMGGGSGSCTMSCTTPHTNVPAWIFKQERETFLHKSLISINHPVWQSQVSFIYTAKTDRFGKKWLLIVKCLIDEQLSVSRKENETMKPRTMKL